MFGMFDVDRSQCEYYVEVGKVAGDKTFTETHIYGSGGTNNSQFSVSSTSTQKNQFFLLKNDGSEIAVEVLGNYPVRTGNFVAVGYMKLKSRKNWNLFYFRNFATGDEFVHPHYQNTKDSLGCLTLLPLGVVGFFGPLILVPVFGIAAIFFMLIGGFGLPLLATKMMHRSLYAIANQLAVEARRDSDKLYQIEKD